MKIEHIAIWTKQLDEVKDFYQTHFNADANQKYVNNKKGFSSYFLNFDSGARLELMHSQEKEYHNGNTHIAFSLGSKAKVDAFYAYAQTQQIKIIAPPRTTGDGYYELLIADPENNFIELTV